MMDLSASLVPYRRRYRRRATPAHAEEIHRALDALREVLPDTGWELGGGIALDAVLGSFRRHHGDVDLHVDESDLPAVVRVAQSRGYSLERRIFWSRVSRSSVLLLTRDPDVRQGRPRYLGGLMLRSKQGSRTERLLVDLDLSVYARKKDRYVRQDRKIEIPEAWWRWGSFRTEAGTSVPLAHPRHLLAIKRRRAHPTDREDRRLLQEWLAAHPEAA